MPPEIQVDMVDVQLGASVLLRFMDSHRRIVTVLADGGIKAKGYPQDHVATKVKSILPSTDIDVLIGTHCDEDHLSGLIDVADQFSIGEAILPPIRKPRRPKAGTSVSGALELASADDDSDLPLLINLTDKQFADHIAEQEAIASQADELLKAQFEGETPSEFDDEINLLEEQFNLEIPVTPLFFAANPKLAISQLARIRSSAQKGAIAAKWLNQLVRKLKSKNVPIRSLDIVAGGPEYYEWDLSQRKFLVCSSSTYSSSNEPKFVLLGPSRALIAHHSQKLPIGVYLALLGRIPLKPVTASNQLSYVMLFEAAGQKVLITGDAGCVDFWDKTTKSFFPKLLSEMNDLRVVQVAHHAGNNHRFYHVLQAAGFGASHAPDSFLQISHAKNDSYRPSRAFGAFISALPSTSPTFELLTTSEPDPSKVASFKAYYHSATHTPPLSVGDIQLEYQYGAWKVKQHLVQV